MKCCTVIWKNDERKNSDMKKKNCSRCGQILLLLTGTFLVGFGLGIFIFFESIYDFILNDALKFTNTSPAYKAWSTNDPPLVLNMYLFNWTNPEDITNSSIKPIFNEMGPYRFTEVKDKINISWHANKTVSYTTQHFYYYDEENSEKKLTDNITIINIVPLTISYKMRFKPSFFKRSVSFVLSSMSKMYVTKTVKEVLFDGYDEPILRSLSWMPMISVMDKFGLFYGRNGSIEKGKYSMHYANDEQFGRILSWNHKNRTDFFEGHCGDIKGSAGEFYPLNIKKDKLVLFSSELCKYAELEFEKEVIVKGVRAYKFNGDYLFDNGTERPENSCFCPGECIPSGVFNVSSCRDNSPSFLSMPHFYGADPYYRDAIRGMKPNKSLHEFYLTIEPKSGIIIDIGANMQLNMLLQPVDKLRMYQNVPKVFFPIFYFTQNVLLTDELAANLRMLQNLPEYSNYTVIILISLGTLSILWVLCSRFCCSRTKEKYRLNDKIKANGAITCHEEVPLNDKNC